MDRRSFLICAGTSAIAATVAGCQIERVKGDEPPPKLPLPFPGASDSLVICLDKTQSGDSMAFKALAPDLRQALAVSALRQVIVLNVGAKGEEEAWNTQPANLPLSVKGAPRTDEPILDTTKCGGRAPCEERLKREAQDRAKTKAQETAEDFERERNKMLDDIVDKFLERPTKEPRITDLNAMAMRIAETPAAHAIWLTDGQHNAGTALKPQAFPNQILIGLVPLVIETQNGFTQRFELMKKTYKDAQVKPVSGLTAAIIAEFLNT